MPLRKVCRRPETDYRLQQLHAVNDAAPMDQQKTGMDSANVHAIRVTSTSETMPLPKQQQVANIHITTPVLQTNVSLPPQSMNMDPKKAETNADVQAGNSVTPGSAPFTSIITISSVPEVSTQNMAEGK